MTPPVPPVTHRRLCDRKGCDVTFDPFGREDGVPARYCSALCHRLDKVPSPTRKTRAHLRAGKGSVKRGPVSEASAPQRAAVRDRGCVVCGRRPVDPAHLVPRGLADDDGGDPRAIVPLCREHHRAYDEGRLSLLEHLEPDCRQQLAYAVERHGLIRTLHRVTNQRWAPATKEAA